MARGSTPLSALIQIQVRLVEITCRLCSQMTFEPVCEKTNNLGSDQVNTNWAVQSQKMVRGWKFWI